MVIYIPQQIYYNTFQDIHVASNVIIYTSACN